MGNEEMQPKVCPFCGKKPKIAYTICEDWAIECKNGTSKHAVIVYRSTKILAIKAWNQRKAEK